MEERKTALNKIVYLFELDSVRSSQAEIERAQEALYDEIVLNGNIVVLTMNQISDSLGFLAAVNNDKTTKHILDLFEAGVLRTSSYRKDNVLISTPSQYLQMHIEDYLNKKEKKFFFSGWYIDPEDTDLIRAILDALKNNDPGKIDLYRQRSTTDIKSWSSKVIPYALEDIETFVRMILKMNGDTLSGNPPRDQGIYRNMMGFLKLFSDIWSYDRTIKVRNVIDQGTVDRALAQIDLLRVRLEEIEQQNNRSKWYEEIRGLADEKGQDTEVLKMAEAIIDLCYNYACENSIWNVSRHYDPEDTWSFYEDFMNRLVPYWKEGETGTHRFLIDEGNPYYSGTKELPRWTNTAEIVKSAHKPQERGELDKSHPVADGRKKGGLEELRHNNHVNVKLPGLGRQYEDNLQKESLKWQGRILLAAGKKFIHILLYIIVFFVIDKMEPPNILLNRWYLEILFKTILFGIFTSTLSYLLKVPDLIDLLHQMGILILFFIHFRKTIGIRNRTAYCYIRNERRKDMKQSLKDYMNLIYEMPEEFKNNGNCMKIEKDPNILEKYSQEKNIDLGVVYKSPYHLMVVDLVTDDDGKSYYTYERLLPAVKKGAVVAVPVWDGKYVLLKQYRHALRDFQYAFPRGYGEPDIEPKENVKKEVKEETGADVKDQFELGTVIADSGVSGQKVSVYKCFITEPVRKEGYEGIVELELFSLDELLEKAGKGEINDGYTLAALSLMSAKTGSQ